MNLIEEINLPTIKSLIKENSKNIKYTTTQQLVLGLNELASIINYIFCIQKKKPIIR